MCQDMEPNMLTTASMVVWITNTSPDGKSSRVKDVLVHSSNGVKPGLGLIAPLGRERAQLVTRPVWARTLSPACSARPAWG